jgi:uncharacterized protein YerC
VRAVSVPCPVERLQRAKLGPTDQQEAYCRQHEVDCVTRWLTPARGRKNHDDKSLDAAVEAEYQEQLKKAPALVGSGVTFFPSSRQAIRKRLSRKRQEAEEAELRRLNIEQARRTLDTATAVAESAREPIPVRQLTEVVRLLVKEERSYREIETVTGLSRRRIGYVRNAIKHGDLSWDEAGKCLGPLPGRWNTPEGVRLPKR